MFAVYDLAIFPGSKSLRIGGEAVVQHDNILDRQRDGCARADTQVRFQTDCFQVEMQMIEPVCVAGGDIRQNEHLIKITKMQSRALTLGSVCTTTLFSKWNIMAGIMSVKREMTAHLVRLIHDTLAFVSSTQREYKCVKYDTWSCDETSDRSVEPNSYMLVLNGKDVVEDFSTIGDDMNAIEFRLNGNRQIRASTC